MNNDHSVGEKNSNTAVQLKSSQEVSLKKWYDNSLAAAKENYDKTLALIEKRNRYFHREVKVIQAMATINTVINSKDQQLNTKLLYRIEQYLNAINQDTLHTSNELHVYVKLFGIENTVELLCEMINYFVSSTGSYSKITSIGIMRLATHIANANPFFKMVELFVIFRDGVTGKLSSKETNFNKIDIETFHDWVKNHSTRMADYWELQASKNKAEAGDNNYQPIVDPKLKALNEYRENLRTKLTIETEEKIKQRKK